MIVYDDDDMICDDEYDDLPVSDEIISPFSTDACTAPSLSGRHREDASRLLQISNSCFEQIQSRFCPYTKESSS